nr:unnamed protein product [Callosobruchus analis]
MMSYEAEKPFSKMACTKNKYRSTMTDERLNNLSVLSIEYDLTRFILLRRYWQIHHG